MNGIESIKGKKLIGTKTFYLIKWVNNVKTSWESKENLRFLPNFNDFRDQYERMNLQKRQINILKATLSDLSKEFSVYENASNYKNASN